VHVSTDLCTWVYHNLIYACPWLYARVFITPLYTCVHDFMHINVSRLLCVCVHDFVHVGLSRLNLRVSTTLRSYVYHDFMYMFPWLYARGFITTLCESVHGFMHVSLS
jgi:hypothetical protein